MPARAPKDRAKEILRAAEGSCKTTSAAARPNQPLERQPTVLRLTRSEFTADFELCLQGRCQPMGRWLPSDGGITLLTACSASPGGQADRSLP